MSQNERNVRNVQNVRFECGIIILQTSAKAMPAFSSSCPGGKHSRVFEGKSSAQWEQRRPLQDPAAHYMDSMRDFETAPLGMCAVLSAFGRFAAFLSAWFDSTVSHHKQNVSEKVSTVDTFSFFAVLVQLGRTMVSKTKGRRFKSCKRCQKNMELTKHEASN